MLDIVQQLAPNLVATSVVFTALWMVRISSKPKSEVVQESHESAERTESTKFTINYSWVDQKDDKTATITINKDPKELTLCELLSYIMRFGLDNSFDSSTCTTGLNVLTPLEPGDIYRTVHHWTNFPTHHQKKYGSSDMLKVCFISKKIDSV